jgi:hypothetical protein
MVMNWLLFHVPQVLQQLCNVDQYISIIQWLYHLYPSFHIYWLANFLDDENNEYTQSCLDAVMEAVWKDDDHNEFCGGANSYKSTDGKVVFLPQAESYHHRGLAFAHYSWLEFECIIQLQEKVQLHEKAELINKSLKDCGCKPRPTFPLGINHPLYTSHVGVI